MQVRQASADGSGYPTFVEKEFHRYFDCGVLANGFKQLIAFSCKGRLCPSCWAKRAADTAAHGWCSPARYAPAPCWAKRAADTAAHRVDRVFSEATYWQWVLTFPQGGAAVHCH